MTEGLIFLGVDPETAEQDACRIEHDISRETFEKLKEYWESFVKVKEKELRGTDKNSRCSAACWAASATEAGTG